MTLKDRIEAALEEIENYRESGDIRNLNNAVDILLCILTEYDCIPISKGSFIFSPQYDRIFLERPFFNE